MLLRGVGSSCGGPLLTIKGSDSEATIDMASAGEEDC